MTSGTAPFTLVVLHRSKKPYTLQLSYPLLPYFSYFKPPHDEIKLRKEMDKPSLASHPQWRKKTAEKYVKNNIFFNIYIPLTPPPPHPRHGDDYTIRGWNAPLSGLVKY